MEWVDSARHAFQNGRHPPWKDTCAPSGRGSKIRSAVNKGRCARGPGPGRCGHSSQGPLSEAPTRSQFKDAQDKSCSVTLGLCSALQQKTSLGTCISGEPIMGAPAVLLAVALAILLAPASGAPVRQQASRNKLLLVSFDGFRWNYDQDVDTPNLDAMALDGVKARYMTPAFITLTSPCHFTLVTGECWPQMGLGVVVGGGSRETREPTKQTAMRAWSLDPGGTQCKGNGEAKEGTPSLGRHDPAKGDVRNPYCRGQVIEADKKHLEVSS